MKNNIMPLHIQSLYIYILKYKLTVEEIYANIYNKAPLSSSQAIWNKTHKNGPFPTIAHSVEQAFHHILIFSLLKPQIIDNVDLPMGKLKNEIMATIAEHASGIPLRKRIFRMRVRHLINNMIGFLMKGLR